MPKLRESDAAQLPPTQAIRLLQVLELEARWEALKVGRGNDSTLAMLRARQAAFDAYRNALVEYTKTHTHHEVPEVMRTGPKEIAAWCRIMRAIFRQAEIAGNSPPVHVIAKGYQMAERISELRKVEPLARGDAPTGLAAAITQLDQIILWCVNANLNSSSRSVGISPELV